MHTKARAYIRRVRHAGIMSFLWALVSVGCGSLKNTPEQDATLGALHACDRFPGVRIDRVEASGRYWVRYDSQDDWRRFQECVAAQRRDASKAQHALAEPRDLVHRAYFIKSAPPSSGTLQQAPPPESVFKVDQPVTFFLNTHKTGREPRATFKWRRPDGALVLEQERVLRDGVGASMRSWYAQVLPAAQVTVAGAWSVELVIDGQVVDTYQPVVKVRPPVMRLPTPNEGAGSALRLVSMRGVRVRSSRGR